MSKNFNSNSISVKIYIDNFDWMKNWKTKIRSPLTEHINLFFINHSLTIVNRNKTKIWIWIKFDCTLNKVRLSRKTNNKKKFRLIIKNSIDVLNASYNVSIICIFLYFSRILRFLTVFNIIKYFLAIRFFTLTIKSKTPLTLITFSLCRGL